MRVVFRNNVLIAAALQPRGPSRPGIAAVAFAGGVVMGSHNTFDELRTSLNRPRFDAYVIREIYPVYRCQLQAVSERVSMIGAKLGCCDPVGDKMLETTLERRADCLVTRDDDLLVMSPFSGNPILSRRQFLICSSMPFHRAARTEFS